jgi:hypothetical protein
MEKKIESQDNDLKKVDLSQPDKNENDIAIKPESKDSDEIDMEYAYPYQQSIPPSSLGYRSSMSSDIRQDLEKLENIVTNSLGISKTILREQYSEYVKFAKWNQLSLKDRAMREYRTFLINKLSKHKNKKMRL